MNILLVDDSAFMLDFLPVILEQAGYCEVSLAASGAGALSMIAAAEQKYDCFLLDIDMPKMDGITLCRRIREMEDYSTTPIIMLTQKSEIKFVEGAFAAGANDYITKPFDIKEIGNRLRVADRMKQNTFDALNVKPGVLPEDGDKGVHNFALEDAVHVVKTERLVTSFSLGNYLSKLSRTQLNECQIFAVRVDNIENLYDSCNSRDFALVLSAVNTAIVEACKCPKLLVSHVGNGTFVCISVGDSLPLWPQSEVLIQEHVDSSSVAKKSADEMMITISVGKSILPSSSRNQRVMLSFNRAIQRVAARQQAKLKSVARDASRLTVVY